jgi:hypothetical protein
MPTVTRIAEPSITYTIPPSTPLCEVEVEETLTPQLSSPITSYEFNSVSEDISFKHQKPYAVRLQVCIFHSNSAYKDNYNYC